MTLLIISLVVIIAGLTALGYIIFKKIPDIKNLNVESLTEEKQGKAKRKIIEAKFSRVSSSLKSKIIRSSLPQKGFLSEKVKQIKEKMAKLESQYGDGKDDNNNPKTTGELFEETISLIDNDEFSEAESILISIISKDNKNRQAYEMLGDLYFEIKSYDQAEEIYKYLLKLSIVGEKSKYANKGDQIDEAESDALSSLDVDSQLAVYYEDLGQIYSATNKDDKALDAYLKATSIDPNNPKYLDKLLETSILVGDRGLAKKTFNSFKKINPQNAKLQGWEEAIEKL